VPALGGCRIQIVADLLRAGSFGEADRKRAAIPPRANRRYRLNARPRALASAKGLPCSWSQDRGDVVDPFAQQDGGGAQDLGPVKGGNLQPCPESFLSRGQCSDHRNPGCGQASRRCQPTHRGHLSETINGPADIRRIADRVSYESMNLLQTPHPFSSVEMALWDLVGKANEEPVWRLPP
jgi:hypothetical protein